VFIDETWIKTNMAPLRGWGPKGERLRGFAPHGHWRTLTFLGALRCDRLTAPCVFDGPINGESFRAYVEQQPDVAPGQYVMLAVSDTGHGIAAEHLEQVFEPFFTTKDKGKGTGLGLAMVYGFVKQSAGHVSIYSEVGQGTTVKLYLPRATAGDARATETGEATATVGGSETVLVVEDEEVVRHLVCRVLRAKGYRVLEAPHAEAALALADGASEPIHLLVTDMVMPGLGGPALAARLAAHRPGLRVLFITGYAAEAVERRGELADTSGLLEKPFSADQLACKVREVLAGSA